MGTIRKYRILESIVLGVIIGRDQEEVIYDAGFFLECDGRTIWAVDSKGRREESITVPAAINLWLNRGIIEEIGWPE